MENTNIDNIQNDVELEAFLSDKTEDEMLDIFIEKMLIDKGYSELDEETKANFRNEIKEELIFRINEAIVASLPDDKLTELDELFKTDSATAEKINDIIERSGVDVSEPIQKTMMEFREVYLSAGAE
jgi:hypothetical protein